MKTLVTLLLLLVLVVSPAAAAPGQPAALAEVAVEARLGAAVPLELRFTDAQGQPRPLAEVLPGDRPVLLVLAYAGCRSLCSAVLGALTDVVPRLVARPERDYRLVLVSLDHRERVDVASRQQAALLARIGSGDRPDRWPYLVGDEASVRRLADALGFRYAWDPATGQFAHPAVVFVLTPDARLAAAIEGLPLAPAELDAALERAGRGEILPVQTSEVLRCFRFDPRRLGPSLELYFQLGASLVFLGLVVLVAGLLRHERTTRRRS